jgi:hypothetical protein
MEVSGQLHAPTALTPGKDPSVFTGQQAGFERCGEEKTLTLPVTKTRCRLHLQGLVYLTAVLLGILSLGSFLHLRGNRL